MDSIPHAPSRPRLCPITRLDDPRSRTPSSRTERNTLVSLPPPPPSPSRPLPAEPITPFAGLVRALLSMLRDLGGKAKAGAGISPPVCLSLAKVGHIHIASDCNATVPSPRFQPSRSQTPAPSTPSSPTVSSTPPSAHPSSPLPPSSSSRPLPSHPQRRKRSTSTAEPPIPDLPRTLQQRAIPPLEQGSPLRQARPVEDAASRARVWLGRSQRGPGRDGWTLGGRRRPRGGRPVGCSST